MNTKDLAEFVNYLLGEYEDTNWGSSNAKILERRITRNELRDEIKHRYNIYIWEKEDGERRATKKS